MSITAETAKAHAKDPAVLCCRAEEGITIEAANLEDPAIFDDLVDSGLLNLEGVLTIEQVLGAKLKKTCDSLTALTPDVVEGYKEVAAEEPVEEKTPKAEEVPAEAPAAPAAPAPVQGGVFKLHIGEGKDINLEIRVGIMGGAAAPAPAGIPAPVVQAVPVAEEKEARVMGTLTRKHFNITEVKRGPETA